MSFILDALKKSQAEQSGEGVSLRLQQRHAPRVATRWLAAGLAVLVAFNLALLAWIFMIDTDPAPATVDSQPGPTPSVVQPSFVQPTEAEPAPTRRPEPVRKPPDRTPPAPIPRVALADLPATEQILYNGFIYSTHIYTDDPDLCAVVVDGQRLMAGDAFKGLQVVEITEAGVIFEETRAGQTRQVEVSVLDQWES